MARLMRRDHPTLPFAATFLGIATFSVMDAAMKSASLSVGVYTAMLLRCAIGTGIMLPLWLLGGGRWPAPAVLRVHVIRSVVAAGMAVLFFWGLVRMPMAEAIALSFIAPLIALYLASAMLKETVGPRTVGASLIAFAGVLVIFVGQAQADLGREATIGSIAILASAVCYAFNIILMRAQSLAAGPTEIAFFQSLTVTIILAAIIPIAGVAIPDASDWPWILFAAFLAISSLLILSWAYARAEASYLAATEYTSFLWAALFGWLVFDETLSPYTLAGAAMIVAGCILAARKPAEASPALEAAT
jgi:S-adenosylmethionine uptake transporter